MLKILKDKPKNTMVLIRRSGTRRVYNFSVLVHKLREYCATKSWTLKVVKAEMLNFKKQIQLCREAACVVAMHGSFFANGMFFSKNTIAIEIPSMDGKLTTLHL